MDGVISATSGSIQRMSLFFTELRTSYFGGLQVPESSTKDIRWPCSLEQWFLTFGLQIFLDFNSQKSWPKEVVVKASGSCSPRPSGGPRLGTMALEDSGIHGIKKELSQSVAIPALVFCRAKTCPSAFTVQIFWHKQQFKQ